MSQNFLKPVLKQRVDFYLERMHQICLEQIELGGYLDNVSALEIMKDALNKLEKNEELCYASRRQELENMKSCLKNLQQPKLS